MSYIFFHDHNCAVVFDEEDVAGEREVRARVAVLEDADDSSSCLCEARSECFAARASSCFSCVSLLFLIFSYQVRVLCELCEDGLFWMIVIAFAGESFKDAGEECAFIRRSNNCENVFKVVFFDVVSLLVVMHGDAWQDDKFVECLSCGRGKCEFWFSLGDAYVVYFVDDFAVAVEFGEGECLL